MLDFFSSEELGNVVTIITAVMTLFGGIALRLLSQVVPVIKEKTKNQTLNIVIDTVAKFVEFVVRDLNQTVVSDIKDAAVDGKLTKEEQDSIRARAVSEVLLKLNDSTVSLLQEMVGDVEKFITLLIEAKVDEVRQPKSDTAMRQ